MIRQLGHPTFFVTLTSAECFWEPLCKALQCTCIAQQTKHNETIEDKDLDCEIRKKPVICSCYFNHRVNAFQRMMLKNPKLFDKVSDYFLSPSFKIKEMSTSMPCYGQKMHQYMKIVRTMKQRNLWTLRSHATPHCWMRH